VLSDTDAIALTVSGVADVATLATSKLSYTHGLHF